MQEASHGLKEGLLKEIEELKEVVELKNQEIEKAIQKVKHLNDEHELHIRDRNERIEELMKELREREGTFKEQFEGLHSSMRLKEEQDSEKEGKGLSHIATTVYLDSIIKQQKITIDSKDQHL